MKQWLSMGGYAGYVWTSYALTLAVAGANIIWARAAVLRARADVRRRLAMRRESA